MGTDTNLFDLDWFGTCDPTLHYTVLDSYNSLRMSFWARYMVDDVYNAGRRVACVWVKVRTERRSKFRTVQYVGDPQVERAVLIPIALASASHRQHY